MNEDLDYRLYVLAEIAYEKENEGLSDEELFPMDWYSIRPTSIGRGIRLWATDTHKMEATRM